MHIVNQAKHYLENVALMGVVYAQTEETGSINLTPQGDNFDQLANLTFGNLLSAAVQAILVVAAVVAFFFLIIGGIKWITSGGDKGQVESARNTVTAALIGLLIVFATFAIIKLIAFFFGVDILNLELAEITGLQ